VPLGENATKSAPLPTLRKLRDRREQPFDVFGT
jgi:hypothetical protein